MDGSLGEGTVARGREAASGADGVRGAVAGSGVTPAAGLRRFDLVFIGTIVVLTALSGLALWFDLSLVSDDLDIAINTVAALAGAGAAGLAWVRFSEFGQRPAALEASAFVVLLTTRGLLVVLAIVGLSMPLGLSLDAPRQWPLYAWSLARALTAILLILAAWQTLRPFAPSRLPAWAVVAVPGALVVALIGLLPTVERDLPPLIGAEGIAALRGQLSARAGMTDIGLVLQAAIAALYLWGAALHRRIHRRGERSYAGYLSIALVVAAFGQLHWAIRPGIYGPAVTPDDFLRAAFSVILLLGIQSQLWRDVGDLRRANQRLAELREAELQRVALETRAQLAREVHDGLAQELWFAKLKSGRLQQLLGETDGTPPDARELADEVGAAVDRALGDSRVALTAIRAGLDGELPLEASLEAYVVEFGERTGLATSFESAGDLPPLSPRAAAEALRVVVEALANTVKHADANQVEVRIGTADSTVEVSVADNGAGFEPGSIEATRYGIRGMRERAALIGGRLDIRSEVGEGTTVVLRLPLDADPEAGR